MPSLDLGSMPPGRGGGDPAGFPESDICRSRPCPSDFGALPWTGGNPVLVPPPTAAGAVQLACLFACLLGCWGWRSGADKHLAIRKIRSCCGVAV